MRNVGFGRSVPQSIERLLSSKFGENAGSVNRLISEMPKVRGVSDNTLLIILLSEVSPADWRKWPKTWLNEKRVKSFFESLKPMYWEAFSWVTLGAVSQQIDEWNNWCVIPVAKMGRVVGRPVSVKKMYWMGKGFKDIFVVTYLCLIKGITLEHLFKNFVRVVRDVKVIEPYCWKWLNLDKVEIKESVHKTEYRAVDAGG